MKTFTVTLWSWNSKLPIATLVQTANSEEEIRSFLMKRFPEQVTANGSPIDEVDIKETSQEGSFIMGQSGG